MSALAGRTMAPAFTLRAQLRLAKRLAAASAVGASSSFMLASPWQWRSVTTQTKQDAITFPVTAPLKFVSEGVCIPEASKVAKGSKGEDAMLLHRLAVGVADGVGGWADVGVDAGFYSRQLVHHAEQALNSAEDEGKERTAAVHPWALLSYAHSMTKEAGSSTLVIALAGPDGTVHVTNLGDSACQHWRHVRPSGMIHSGVHFKLSVEEERKLWEKKHETTVQEEGGQFNFPKQLAADKRYGNPPTDADVYAWPAQPGDVLLAVSDGVIDNLHPTDIQTALASFDWAPCHQLARMRRLRYLEALKIERSLAGPSPSLPTPPVDGPVEFGSGKGRVLERFVISGAAGEEEVTIEAVKAKEAEVRAILKALASKIASDAVRVGNDRTSVSTPFAIGARKRAMWNYMGGKPDDVTVAVGLVVHDDSPSAVEAVVAYEDAQKGSKAAAGA